MKFKKLILSAGIIGIITGMLSGTSFAYNDINGHWAESYIGEMADGGVLEQFEDSDIIPDRYMNRAECAELISDLMESYYRYVPMIKESNKKFPDLTDGTRNTNKVRALSRIHFYSLFLGDYNYPFSYPLRIIDGYPDGTFQPYNNVTRAEFSKMLVLALDSMGILRIGNAGDYYSDFEKHWGKRYLEIAFGYGIMNGYSISEVPNTEIKYIEMKPDNPITRAEAIKMTAIAKDIQKPDSPHISRGGTRPDNTAHLYYIDDLEDYEKVYRTRIGLMDGFKVTAPINWFPFFHDFGDGIEYVFEDGTAFYTDAAPLEGYLESQIEKAESEGAQITQINVSNAETAYKAENLEAGYAAVYARKGVYNYYSVVEAKDPSSPNFLEAVKLLDKFEVMSDEEIQSYFD